MKLTTMNGGHTGARILAIALCVATPTIDEATASAGAKVAQSFTTQRPSAKSRRSKRSE